MLNLKKHMSWVLLRKLTITIGEDMKKHFQRRGFSLIELLAIVAIVGTLAALIIARASDHIDNASCKSCFHNKAAINAAIERYALIEEAFPTAISDLDDPEYLEGAVLTCPVTGNAYTLNTTTNRVDGHSTTTNPGDH